MRVVVTGGSGFVGRRVVAALRESGHDVTQVGRRPGADGGSFIRSDFQVGRMPWFGDAAVVHCAAVTEDGWSDEIAETNLRLTKAALELARGPFIHVSSSSVYDLSKPSVGAQTDEATGQYRWYNSYGPSKLASENLVKRSRSQATILRPHGVYGAGDPTLVPRLRRAARFGMLPLPAGGRAFHQLTWVENLACAIMAALEMSLPGVNTFNVADPEPVTVREAALAAIGRYPVLGIPLSMAIAAAEVVERMPVRSQLSVYSVLQLGMDRTYDIEPAKEALGYRPAAGGLIRAFG
jgi:2-alkyl-3-oxoalkanoate reductase